MKLRDQVNTVLPLRRREGFTLVEIAICLGIIGFALVAIIGILPAGLQVQRDNKEDTVINQEGMYILGAIRNGAEELTNLAERVEFVELRNVDTGLISGPYIGLSAHDVVGRLSTPIEYETNEVRAVIRAGVGAATDAGTGLELTYQVTIRNYPYLASSPNEPTLVRQALADRLRDVRVDVRWPVLRNGKVGTGRQIFRCQVSGTMVPDPEPGGGPFRFWFLRP
jgi:type II secretory pathway pseudopilin PulG